VNRAAPGAAVLATLVLLLNLLFGSLLVEGALALLLGGLWVVGYLRRWPGAGGTGLAASVVLAAWGVWRGAAVAPMLVAVTLALAAWDLDSFGRLLGVAGQVADEQAVWRTHLLRLAPVAAAGLILGLIALGLRVSLTFGWVMLLGAVAMFGLSRAIALLRRHSDE
jgi:hypothetical protein